ncbi:MAG TPA: hypothetical protein VKV80_06980 [Streptosporangiaceae bacterium]|nr:hypothetical protein [Streptosporangiaceae bacterium]
MAVPPPQAAVTHAIGEGKLPQWRARFQASRRIARALEFRELGSQVNIRLAGARRHPDMRFAPGQRHEGG